MKQILFFTLLVLFGHIFFTTTLAQSPAAAPKAPAKPAPATPAPATAPTKPLVPSLPQSPSVHVQHQRSTMLKFWWRNLALIEIVKET
jgi:hypothetical protein